jgi:methanogenic corrinoid protein MtbC1
MTFARLRDIINMLTPEQLSQSVQVLTGGRMVNIDQVESFRGDIDLAGKFGANPKQVFLTNNKEL